jgi:hypothetical protein
VAFGARTKALKDVINVHKTPNTKVGSANLQLLRPTARKTTSSLSLSILAKPVAVPISTAMGRVKRVMPGKTPSTRSSTKGQDEPVELIASATFPACCVKRTAVKMRNARNK